MESREEVTSVGNGKQGGRVTSVSNGEQGGSKYSYICSWKLKVIKPVLLGFKTSSG